MLKKNFFGTDGIRGSVTDGEISSEFVLKLGVTSGVVLKNYFSEPNVIIGKDTRSSGDMLECAIISGLVKTGVNVVCAGRISTPAVAFFTKSLRFSLGIVISASHNSFHDNGFKFFDSDGNKLSDFFENEIEKVFNSNISYIKQIKIGKKRNLVDANGRYVEFCKSSFPTNLNLKNFKIVLDSANGAACGLLGLVYRELGSNVIEFANIPNGENINDGVGSMYPQTLSKLVLKNKADFGVALDGDGDRFIMSDKEGRIFNGDELLYAITKEKISKLGVSKVNGVVGTLMSNLGLEKSLLNLGLEFRRSKVGDKFISEMLRETGWFLGGESSGHILCLDTHTTGDGIINSLQVFSAIINSGLDLDKLISDLVLIPQVLVNVPIEGKKDWKNNVKFIKAQENVAADLGGKGRLLVRSSGTEPLLRIMVEAETENEAKNQANYLSSMLE